MAERISIIGATITGNHGAEAMLSVTVAKIRQYRPQAKITIFSYYPSEDKKHVKRATKGVDIQSGKPTMLIVHLLCALLVATFRKLHISLPISLMPQSFVRLVTSETLVDIQGVSFNDGRVLYLPFKVLCMLPALILGIRVVKLSQSFGPFENRLNRGMAKWLLPQCAAVHARGRQSYDHLKAIGLSKPVLHSSPDLGFLFRKGMGLYAASRPLPKRIGARKLKGWVALCPSSLVDRKRCRALGSPQAYLALLHEMVQEIKAQGFGVIVFPTAGKETSSHRNNDILVIRKLKETVQLHRAAEGTIFIDYPIGANEISTILSSCVALVTSRFHGMVLGLNSAVPTLVVGWGHKYEDTMAMFGQSGYVLDFSIENKEATTKLQKLLKERKKISGILSRELGRVRAGAERQLRDIAKKG